MEIHANAIDKVHTRIENHIADELKYDLQACKPTLQPWEDVIEAAKAQADILVAALQCGITNVILNALKYASQHLIWLFPQNLK